VLRPDAAGRIFTFTDVVARAEATGPRRSDETLAAYVRRLGSGRDPGALLHASPADDIADPVGRGPARYRETARQLDDLAGRLVAHLWPG